jgi:hypothetical protein
MHSQLNFFFQNMLIATPTPSDPKGGMTEGELEWKESDLNQL